MPCVALPRAPATTTARQDARAHHTEEALARGAGAHVTLVRSPEKWRPLALVPGVLNIWPSTARASRTDALGMPALSPARLGPVMHGQPGFSPAASVQDYVDASACYPSETELVAGADGLLTRAPAPLFFKRQRAGFAGRGGCGAGKARLMRASTEERARVTEPGFQVDRPLFFVATDERGAVRFLDVVVARFLLAVAYEALAEATPEFATLRDQYLAHGVALHLVGPGLTEVEDVRADEVFADGGAPYRHEHVLQAMLRRPARADRPWWRHARAHPARYEALPYHGKFPAPSQ